MIEILLIAIGLWILYRQRRQRRAIASLTQMLETEKADREELAEQFKYLQEHSLEDWAVDWVNQRIRREDEREQGRAYNEMLSEVFARHKAKDK